MKKIYSFLVSALIAAGASAALPAKTVEAYKTSGNFSLAEITNAKPLNVKLEKTGSKLDLKKPAGKNVFNFKPVDKKSHVNKVLADDGMQWETIGEADFYDAITVAPLAEYGAERQTFKVEIQESQAQNGYYRLVDIHKNNPMVGDRGLSLVDPEGDSFMIFNIIDAEGMPILSDCKYNLLDPLEYEHEYTFAQVSANGLEPAENGVIIFPAGTIAVGLGVEPYDVLEYDDDYNPIIPDEYSEKVFLTTEDLVIVLPGATYDPNAGKKDYSFMMVQDNLCVGDDNTARFGFAGGEDITTYKYFIASGQYSVSEDNLDFVAQNGEEGLESGYYYNLNFPTAGWRTVFVVGLNEEGERVAGDGLYFYSYAHNPEEWTSLGNVLFTDDTFGPLYGLEDAEPVEVEILVSNENPSIYRLVNPYVNNSLVKAYAPAIALHEEHNHYIDIDVTDPEAVFINDVPIGVNVTGQDVSLCSDGPTGKFINNKITFSQKGLLTGLFGGEDDGYYYANQNGRFAVEFPSTLTVKALDMANEVPVAAATVTVGEDKAETNENGEAKFTLYGVIGTKVPVTVTKDNLYWYGEADFTETAEAWAIAELSIPSIINIKAVDKNSEPVAGAYVSAAGRTVTTDENGEVKLPLNNVAGTKVPVTIYKDYMFWEGEADFTEQNEVNLAAELKNPDCTLTVIAMDKDGEPVAGAFVNVAGKEAETGENGRAVINVGDVIGTVLHVTVMKDYMFWEGEADFTEGMERTVIAELKNPDCMLKVKVVNEESEPVVDAKVVAGDKEEVTNENGEVTIAMGDVIGTKVAITVTKDGYDNGVGEADFTETAEPFVIITLNGKTNGLTLSIIEDNDDIKVYDLNGRHVENPAIGNIYIINGKKVRIME